MSEETRGSGDVGPRLDRRLDAALRQMAGGEGPVDMRHRVLARLNEPPRAVMSRGSMLAAAAVIALAVGIAVLLRAPAVHAPTGPVAHRDAPRAATPASPRVAPAGSPGPTQTARRTRLPRHALRPQPLEWVNADRVEEGAVEMEPIEPAPLAVTPLDTPRMAIAPLRIEPMLIAPLAEPQP
jgi:hypothetical protein